jgi:lysophospholipase L1-like esterase
MIKNISLLVGILLSIVTAASACPEISGIPDYNCDGKIRISVIGDSFVFGFGDTKNKNSGGYITRARKELPLITIDNLGVLGLRVDGAKTMLKKAFQLGTNEKVREALVEADVVILDLGRNDRWLFGEPVDTYKGLQEVAKTIRTEVRALTKLEPLVVMAVLMLPNRGSQGPWVKALNTLISKGHSSSKPADLRFDLVSKRLIGSDQIHPTSKGYSALSAAFVRYIKGTLSKRLRALRPDTDGDGLPDAIETSVTNTDPNLTDTDGDGVSDGAEVLENKTDPLVVNSQVELQPSVQ